MDYELGIKKYEEISGNRFFDVSIANSQQERKSEKEILSGDSFSSLSIPNSQQKRKSEKDNLSEDPAICRAFEGPILKEHENPIRISTIYISPKYPGFRVRSELV